MNIKYLLAGFFLSFTLWSCQESASDSNEDLATKAVEQEFQYQIDQFADLKILRYFIGSIVNMVVTDLYASTSFKRFAGSFIRHFSGQPRF